MGYRFDNPNVGWLGQIAPQLTLRPWMNQGTFPRKWGDAEAVRRWPPRKHKSLNSPRRVRNGFLHKIVPDCPNSCLRTVGYPYFSQYMLDMLFYRFIANVQRLSDFFVGEPIYHLLEHFAFTLR